MITLDRVLELQKARLTQDQKMKAVPEFSGSVFSAKQVGEILDLSWIIVDQHLPRKRWKLNLASLGDLKHLEYHLWLTGTLDRRVLDRVLSKGTDERTVAKVLGMSVEELRCTN